MLGRGSGSLQAVESTLPNLEREMLLQEAGFLRRCPLRRQILKGLQVGPQSSGEEPRSHQVPPLKKAELGVLGRPTVLLSRG